MAEEQFEDRYITLPNLNKKIYVFGFDPIQLGIAGISSAVMLIISWKVALVLIIPVLIVMKKIKKENSKGNPDYIKSYFFYSSCPKYIIDSTGLNKKLIKKLK